MDDATIQELTYDCMLVTEDNFSIAMMALEANDEIAVDTETTGFEVRTGRDYLMGFCFSVEGMSCYMPFRHPVRNLPMEKLYHIEKILNTKDLIWHNRKFDMHSVKTIGIDPLAFTGKQYDTLMIATLIDEESYSKELDYLAKRYLKLGKLDKDFVEAQVKIFGSYANLPPEVYERYGPVDAKVTRLLKRKLWPLLQRDGSESVYWDTESPFTTLLYQLEQRGVGTDTSFAAAKAELGTARMGTIKRELGGLNPASPTELGKYLLDELGLPVLAHTDSCEGCKAGLNVDTHEGKASFNKHVMEEYDEILQSETAFTNSEHRTAAKRIAEFRGWQKAVTSLYTPIVEKTTPAGKIHTEFKQHGTVTGRLSSWNPNLQQIPRSSPKRWNGNAKSAFNSGVSDDFALYGWDYSQLELRLAAAYGNETILLAEFAKDRADPFSVLAPGIFGSGVSEQPWHCEECKVNDEFRHKTKNGFVYPHLYGAGLNKIAYTLNMTPEDTRELYNNYKKTISGIVAVSNMVTSKVKKDGTVAYWDGRKRHLRNRDKAYKAWNSVCQGGAAQMVKQAMLRISKFETEDCFMVLQVHDEITFAIKRSKIPEYEPEIVRAMTTFPIFNVRLAVEGKEWK